MARSNKDRVTFRKFHSAQQEIVAGLTGLDVLRCGRRLGKTTLLEDLGGYRAMKGKSVGWFAPNYKLLLPSYKRVLKILKPVVKHASKVDSIIELETGGVFEFWTLNDEDAGRSRAYDLAIIDEASLVPGLQEIWEQSIRPTLMDRGGKAIMAGTPKGVDPENFFYNACTDKERFKWNEFHMPTWRNPTLDAESVANLINEYPPLVYQQEVRADFVDWSGVAFFAEDKMLLDGQPIDMPDRVDYVFAVIDTALKDGKQHDGTAVTIWAYSKFRPAYPLLLLDWDCVQIEGATLEHWLPTIFQRLEELAKQCGARYGSAGAYIEDKASGIVLLQQAANRGWPAQPLPSTLTALGKDERALSVSGYAYQGLMKITRPAFEKTTDYKGVHRNHFLAQVCGFRLGSKRDAQDDLLDCATYSMAIALGNSDGF